jgi:hypothetical protein
MGAAGQVIIRTNAGGGTLARHFAPSRVLLLVREDWSPPNPPPAPARRHEEGDAGGYAHASS